MKIVAGIISFLLLALISLPFLVPVDALKGKAIEQIERLTGRSVAMGAVQLTVFPNIALSAQDVSIGNPAWVKGSAPMAKVKTLRIGVELMPLLHKDIHITTLTLESPVVHLVKKGGEANWQFGPAAHAAAQEKHSGVAPEEGAHASGAPLRLDSLKVSDGTFTYEDALSGSQKTLTSVGLVLSGKNMPDALAIKGSAVIDGTTAEMDLTLGRPLGIMAGGASEVSFKGSFGALAANWKGGFSLKAGVPSLTGDITIPVLEAAAAKERDAGTPSPSHAPSGIPVAAGHWSAAPIELGALRSANANITLTIGKLVLTKMTLADVKLHVALENGALQALVDELALFGGSVKLDVTAQASGAAGIKATAKNIQTEALLSTLADSKVLTGTLNGNVDVTVRGHSQKEMVATLNGAGGFSLHDGIFHGGNLLNMTRNIATSFQGGQSSGETTDFKSLAGTFTAKNGVLFNDDLKMESPLLSLTGKGQIDLPEWLIHYLLTPVVTTSHGTQAQPTPGIAVPVQVEGSLDSPSYHPDLRGVLEEGLKNPENIKENLKNIKGNLKDIKKNINKDTLKNLLGR